MIGQQPVPFTGGVNSFEDPLKLPDDKLQPSTNLVPRERGFPGTRPSLNFVREVIPDYRPWNSDRATEYFGPGPYYWQWAQGWKPLRFMFNPNGPELTGVFVCDRAKTIIHTEGNTEQIMEIAAGDMVFWAMPGRFAGPTEPYCFRLGEGGQVSLFPFNGIMYVFGGGNPGCHLTNAGEGPGGGGTLGWSYFSNQFSGENNAGFSPQGAAVVRDRVVYWKGPKIFWSDRNDPLQLVPNVETAGGIDVISE
jgi:hypothetical protein